MTGTDLNIYDRLKKLLRFTSRKQHIAPLVVLRIAFGLVMFAGTLRFWLMGWIEELYVKPVYHFTFYGFDWVKVPGETGIYLLFSLMLIASIFIALGLFYRFSSLLFFLAFTYVELIDKTYYLNHYYFISIMSFLLVFVPAHRYFSLDVLRKPALRRKYIPGWMVDVFKLQLAMVYFHAGVAKLNYDWMINAMPMKNWLLANNDMPVIGSLFNREWMAYAASWFGALYDISIPFLLFIPRTRLPGFFLVIFFHMLTWLLFPIGMFPFIMILLTTIFFSTAMHKKILYLINIPLLSLITTTIPRSNPRAIPLFTGRFGKKAVATLFVMHLVIQLSIPWRYLLYPGNLFWTEEGYRFSWRVMLMEKAGTAFFYVSDPETGKSGEADLKQYLTPYQELMMACQPDMILQFAHFLKKKYTEKGLSSPEIRVRSYVTLNGSGSRLFINPEVDLGKKERGFHHKDWILPFKPESPSANTTLSAVNP